MAGSDAAVGEEVDDGHGDDGDEEEEGDFEMLMARMEVGGVPWVCYLCCQAVLGPDVRAGFAGWCQEPPVPHAPCAGYWKALQELFRAGRASWGTGFNIPCVVKLPAAEGRACSNATPAANGTLRGQSDSEKIMSYKATVEAVVRSGT